MSASPPDLADLRRQLDEIDDRLHDLLIDRAEIVGEVAASKKANEKNGDAGFYQPAREAQILRRLAARHHGPLPFASIVRIWREILSATVRLETPFAVAVFAPAEAPWFWDLARDHYGSHTPMSSYRSIGQVIRAVTEGRASVGILPMPQEGDPDPWWRHLLSEGNHAPRVIARLPFGPRGNAQSDGADALAIGSGKQQETGADRTLFATEWAADISRARFLGLLSSADLSCTFCASWEHPAGAVSLVEIDGYVPISDPRLAGIRARLGIALYRLLPFGGYALPLPMTPVSAGAVRG
ncbi:MAG TPA: chorismate mutase [Stellaceae bacterium]|nr:chorismate mutase [Stellaceae bacterium]